MEINLMKKISDNCCPNIVNMVGCITLQEPLCLLTELVPYGNLLDYLRSQRKVIITVKGTDNAHLGILF